MTSENQWNRIANEDIFVVDDKSWLRTKQAKALQKHFVSLENEWKSKSPEILIDEAWYIYLMQILKDVIFDTGIAMHVGWIPENFTRLPFNMPVDGDTLFKMFIDWFTGECAGDIYKMDEDTTETVQAGMYEVAKDWFKYQKKDKRNGRDS